MKNQLFTRYFLLLSLVVVQFFAAQQQTTLDPNNAPPIGNIDMGAGGNGTGGYTYGSKASPIDMYDSALMIVAVGLISLFVYNQKKKLA